MVADETKIRLENQEFFLWAALNPETMEIVHVQVSKGRSGLDALTFLSKMLRRCENKPEVRVDGGPWYPWALKRLGLEFRQQTFGKRSPVESLFGVLKRHTRRFWNRHSHHSNRKPLKN